MAPIIHKLSLEVSTGLAPHFANVFSAVAWSVPRHVTLAAISGSGFDGRARCAGGCSIFFHNLST